MNNSLEIKNHWNKIGDMYQNMWHSLAQKKMSQQEINFLELWVPKERPLKIMDLGVGNGRVLESLVKLSASNSEIYGLDIAEEMVDFCRKKFFGNKKIKNIQVLKDNQKLDIYGEKFDIITSIRVIKYNENWEQMLIQLISLLREDGLIIFSMPNSNSITRFLKTNITYIRTSPSKIASISRDNNMRVAEIRGFSRIPDLFYKIDNNTVGRILIFLEKLLSLILGKYFLCREVFYILSKK